MPVKRRVLKGRPHRITPEAIELFGRGLAILKRGDEEEWEGDGGRRREYLDLEYALRVELGLAPYEMTPLDAGAQPPTYNNLYALSRAQARALRVDLIKACRLDLKGSG